jgi:hypothetical protein
MDKNFRKLQKLLAETRQRDFQLVSATSATSGHLRGERGPSALLTGPSFARDVRDIALLAH